MDSSYAIAFVKRASAIRMDQGDFAAAELDLEQALHIKADAATPLYLRGVIRARRGETEQAVADLRAALPVRAKNWPGRPDAERLLQQLIDGSQDKEAANRQ